MLPQLSQPLVSNWQALLQASMPLKKPWLMHVCPARSAPSHCSMPSTMLLPHTGPPPVPPEPPVPELADPLLLAAGLPLELLLAVVLLLFAEVLPLTGGNPVLVLAAAPPLPPAPDTSITPLAHAIVARAIIQPIQYFRPTKARVCRNIELTLQTPFIFRSGSNRQLVADA